MLDRKYGVGRKCNVVLDRKYGVGRKCNVVLGSRCCVVLYWVVIAMLKYAGSAVLCWQEVLCCAG